MNYLNGLKLWSTNENYVSSALNLYQKNLFDYIELYIKPNSLDKYIKLWVDIKIPFIIHAPHYGDNLNFSIPESFENNKKMANESIEFANKLNAKYIIFHPGVNGEIEETIAQINKISEKRIIIENKPYLGLKNEKCLGHSPEDIKLIQQETNAGFCLDIGHAICSANSKMVDPIEYIEKFIDLNPSMYHLTDGNYKSQYDSHLHFGEGDYPIKKILKLIKNDSTITNEAKKNSSENLDDFKKDMEYLKKIDKFS